MLRTFHYHQDQQLAYIDEGPRDGFPVLVQHGLIASIQDGQLFDRLRDAGVRIISVARPGYGASSPYPLDSLAEWGDLIAQLIAALGLGQVDVLGISSGAMYSYAIGWRLPTQVRAIFILSGLPALYDPRVVAQWPYPVIAPACSADLQPLAQQLFFAHLSAADRAQPAIQDSLQHGAFGVAQDLALRWRDWGFSLAAVPQPVIMQHSQHDPEVPFGTAEITATLLPQSQFIAHPTAEHFSEAILTSFIETQMLPWYTSR